MIEVKNLSCGYGKKEVIHNVDVCFGKGEVTAVVGPNGCGKTTVMKAMAGLIKVKNDRIYIDNKDINQYKDMDRAKKIAFMPQIRHVPAMSVYDFLMCARYPYLGMSKQPEKSDIEAVENAISITGIGEYRMRSLKKLSGGERQKVYFAFMLAQQAEVLILDEPTTYLDIERQFEILDMIRLMKKNNKTVVMVLHDICHSLKFADKIVVMDEGRVKMQGTPDEIIESGVLEKIYNIKLKELEIDGNKEYITVK